ncbi:hypothetical protein GE061_015816 [Apolygus lucorum]|uniref:Uncharacterized protein n=1 Tax=Apolygus lucorum TaxID=248454 RepID=A0A6A4JN67_APOLU|nr:hypothetical protein GE061_015816 [Apolygus lucorum]
MASRKHKELSQVKQFYDARKSANDSLLRINSYLSGYDVESKDLCSLQVRFDKLPVIEQRFESSQQQLNVLEPGVDFSDDIEQFEDLFFSTQAGLMTHIQSIEREIENEAVKPRPQQNQQHNLSSSSLLQLARLKMPEFDGKYSDWLSFRDMFRSLVHGDGTVPTIYKFHQLKSHLKGEPANLIDSIEVTIDNYPKVWDLLCSRYDNNKRIIQSHISEIFNLQKIEFSEAKILRNFTMTLKKNLRALATLGEPIDKWDSLIIYIVCSKLDKFTLRAWEEYSVIHSPNGFSFVVLEEFLTNRCTSLEAYESQCVSAEQHTGRSGSSKFGSRDQRPGKPNTSNCMLNNASEGRRCLFCKGSHPIFYCNEFKAKPVPERWAIITGLKLCSNCFSTQHSNVEQCPSKSTCRVCSARHNSILHMDQHDSGASWGQGQPSLSSTGSAFLNVKAPNLPTSTGEVVERSNHQTHSSSTFVSTSKKARQVILPTAVVTILDRFNNPHDFRLVLDSGSQLNLITKRMADILGLEVLSGETTIHGINSSHSNCDNFINATIYSKLGKYTTCVDFHIIPNITTTSFPSKSFDLDLNSVPSEICDSLADPKFNCSSSLDGLLGTQSFFFFFKKHVKHKTSKHREPTPGKEDGETRKEKTERKK